MNEKLLEIWKKKAASGNPWAIEKLKSLGQTSVNDGQTDVLLLSPVRKYNNTSVIATDVSLENVEKKIKRKYNSTRTKMTGFITFRCPHELKAWLKTKGNTSKFLVRILTKIKLKQEEALANGNKNVSVL